MTRRARTTKLARALALALALLAAGLVSTADAHPRGTLRIAASSLRAGDSVTVTGLAFEPNDGVTLVLVGVGGRHALGDIPTDSAGGFRRAIVIPAATAAGQYRLAAESVDGDEVASLDVAIVPGRVTVGATAPLAPEMEGMPGHDGMMTGPTGAPLDLARAHNSAVTATAVLLIAACTLTGVALLRGARPHPTTEDSQ